MKRLLTIFLILLPLLVAAQGEISKKQSWQRLEAISRLQENYNIDSYWQRYGDVFVARRRDCNSPDSIGVVDINGRVIIPFEYDWIAPDIGVELFILFKDTLMGFADLSGRIIAPCIYDPIDDTEVDICTKGLFVVSRNGKSGVLDCTGRFVVPLKYDENIYIIDSGYIKVYDYDIRTRTQKDYLLRFNGDTVMGPYKIISPLGDGLLMVCDYNNLCGLYDLEGRELAKCQYDRVGYYFNHGLMGVQKGKQTGVIDRTGREVIPVAANRFRGNMPNAQSHNLFVMVEGDKCGAVDSLGNTVIPFEYDELACVTSDRFVLVKNEDNAYVFDTMGRLVAVYDNYDWYDEWPLITARPLRRDGKWGLVDSAWRELTPFIYKDAYWLLDNYCAMTIDDATVAVVDSRGKTLFKGPYQYINGVGAGVWMVSTLDGEEKITGYVDLYGQTTLTKKELKQMEKIMRRNAKLDSEIVVEEEVAELGEDEEGAAGDNKVVVKDTEAAVVEDDNDIDEVFVSVVENSPEFPGGDSALFMYICMNLSYPDEAREKNVEGTVFVSFVVEKDGSVDHVKVLRDIGGGCGKAAAEMVKSMPRWKPGTQAGKPVRTQFTLPLKFQLIDDDPSDSTIEQKCQFQYKNSAWKK